MKIELMDLSKRLAEQPQQQWFSNGAPGSHTALFAGNGMSLQHERDGRFHLYYLGCAAHDFASAEAAKKAAPEFARRVLARLSDMVSAHAPRTTRLLARYLASARESRLHSRARRLD